MGNTMNDKILKMYEELKKEVENFNEKRKQLKHLKLYLEYEGIIPKKEYVGKKRGRKKKDKTLVIVET